MSPLLPCCQLQSMGRARGPQFALALAAGTAGIGIAAAIHVGAVALAARLAALASGFACFFRSEFVGRALFMRGAAAFAGDFALALRVHGSEAAVRTPFFTALVVLV